MELLFVTPSRGLCWATTAILLVLGACSRGSNSPSPTSGMPALPQISGAPPMVVCGQVLSTSLAGAVLIDATRDTTYVSTVSAEGLIFLQLTDGCGEGVDVSVNPVDAATVIVRALARDRRAVAIGLQPKRPTFEIALERPSGVSGSVTVALEQTQLGIRQGKTTG